ncbi:response regulator [Sulfitobacter albidus]|uniref:Response regulator n=2 Tax=Sulfitobacter albidus TaxID=2829501 RepID=A0A975JGC7_9RHOB|nr:response regulator [Sulfitobacter albidus]
MMVDDEQIDQMMYRRIIDRSGMAEDVVGFTYAEEALAYLKEGDRPPVDLILLDINMPRMTGFEFLEAACAELGEAFNTSVVIMLTTSLNPRDKARAASFDMVRGYVNKPLEPENLRVAAEAVKEVAANRVA